MYRICMVVFRTLGNRLRTWSVVTPYLVRVYIYGAGTDQVRSRYGDGMELVWS